MTKIRHLNNRITILYNIINDSIVYKVAYCSLKDQFSRKKGVQIASEKERQSFQLNYKPDRSNRKIIALILLNELMLHNQPRGLYPEMSFEANQLGFEL